MKFQELPLNNHFTTSSFPDITFEKVVRRKGSCCTPALNVFYTDGKGKKKSMLLDNNIDIVPEDSPVPIKIKKKKKKKQIQVESQDEIDARANAGKMTYQTSNPKTNEPNKRRKKISPGKRGGGRWGD